MSADVAKVISQCLTCQRHQKVPTLYHPARAIEVDGIFDQIGIDLVFGLPETKDGYIGVFCIMQKITKYPFVYPIKSKSELMVAGRYSGDPTRIEDEDNNGRSGST